MTELNSSPEVRAYVQNRIGFIELNRPQALNALSLGMIRALGEALDAWRHAPDVIAVVIHSPHPRAFCAGGDVRALYEAGKQGDLATIDAFFTEEYTLNHAIFSFPKPYIALMHGVVMGGGMGISQAAHHTGGLRVVTDSTKMAMPETRIGLFPDVGMSWFLARIGGQLGRYLAVTGATLDAAGALFAGLADAYLPDAELPGLVEALKRESFPDGAAVVTRVAEAASHHVVQPGTSALAEMREAIDTHFARASLTDIVASLEGARASEQHGAWAAYTVDTLQTLSPLSMAVSLELVSRAHGASMADCLRTDLGLTRTTFALGDVQEGIRARLVDKDNAPHWRHATIADVTPEDLASMFESPWIPAEHPLAALHD